MSIPDAFTTRQQAVPAAQGSHPLGYHTSMAELYRIRQMERLLKHALEELEQVKARLNQLEKGTVIQSPDAAGTVNAQHSQAAALMPPLPIAEIEQLAEMAKRFR